MTRAQESRERAKFALDMAAKRLRVKPDYLRRCERNGFPYCLAIRAASLYNCQIDHFLKRKGSAEQRTAFS